MSSGVETEKEKAGGEISKCQKTTTFTKLTTVKYMYSGVSFTVRVNK